MQDLSSYKESFDTLMGVKSEPSDHERILLTRAERYIEKLTWIPGLRMIAVVNSLSMYATHEDSDIDLFVVTSRRTLWFVRVIMTLILWIHGVWRHGEDIAGNFCLSFFVTEDALDMSEIAIEDDIYLFYWIYYMRPVFVVGDVWTRFQKFNSADYTVQRSEIPFYRDKPAHGEIIANILDNIIRLFGEWKSRKSWIKKGKPEGVIISGDILKFHDRDRRREIRDEILKK